MDIKKADLKARYKKLIAKQAVVLNDGHGQAISQRLLPDRIEMIFADVDEQTLSQYGEVVTPSLEDLFVAMNESNTSATGQVR